MQNALSKIISTAGQKAAYDNVCKKLLANKNILAWIMKCCLEEYRDCTIQEITGRYIEGEPQISGFAVHQDEDTDAIPMIRGLNTEDVSIREGTVTYDIRFWAIAPVSGEMIRFIINVEAQNDFYPGYPVVKRNIYYCSRMISAQYGTEFTKSHYEKIKKVYSVFICINPPVYRRNTINCYSVHEINMIGNVKERKENYDLLTAIMICLGDKNNEADSGILRLLEVLLSSERETKEKTRILQKDFGIEMTEKFEREVSEMCDLSKGVEERGIQKGIQRAAQNLMKNMKLSFKQAMDTLEIPEDEREKYRELMNK